MRTRITPKQAAKLLENNPRNRKLSEQLVDIYARDMAEGRWIYNGETIKVDETGALVDGQHRCAAGVKAGVSFETELIEGLPAHAMPTVDSGRRRTAADALMIGGTGHYAMVASAARVTLAYCAGGNIAQSQSTQAIVELVEAYPELEDIAAMCNPSTKIMTGGVLTAVMFLGTRAIGAGNLMAKAERFVEALAFGNALGRRDPRLALRNAFINHRTLNRGRAPQPAWAFAMTATGWNYYLGGEETGMIVVKHRKGRIPVPPVLGGPNPGEGVDSLAGVRLHHNRVKKIARTVEMMDEDEAAEA